GEVLFAVLHQTGGICDDPSTCGSGRALPIAKSGISSINGTAGLIPRRKFDGADGVIDICGADIGSRFARRGVEPFPVDKAFVGGHMTSSKGTKIYRTMRFNVLILYSKCPLKATKI